MVFKLEIDGLDILEYLIFSKNIFSQILQVKILEKCVFVENFVIV